MLALWLVLTDPASAGTLHLTLDHATDPPAVRHATVSAQATPARSGLRTRLDGLTVHRQDGTPLAARAVPRPMPRTVMTPDGGEASDRVDRFTRVSVPWPAEARTVRLDGRPLALPSLRAADPDGEIVTLHGRDDPAITLDLLLLSEGYGADERDAFLADAQRVVDHLLEIEPWGDYPRMVAVHAAFVPGADPGIDDAPGADAVDSPFQCHYGCGGLDRLICCDEATVVDTVDRIAPWADGVLLLVGDEPYGGSGGLAYSTAYTGPFLPDVSAHELSHTLVTLWDEYDYGFEDDRDTPPGPNCAPPDEEPLPWDRWLGDEGVDAYPVCSFTSWVRPTESACMMHSLQDRYCAVCREFVVTSLYAARGLGPLTAAEPPEEQPIVVRPDAPLQVALDVVSPTRFTRVTWRLDGEVVDVTGPQVDLGCPHQAQRLTAEIEDRTPWVRDPGELSLTSRIRWPLDTRACPEPPPPEPDRQGCRCTAGGAPLGALPAALIAAGLIRRRRRSEA